MKYCEIAESEGRLSNNIICLSCGGTYQPILVNRIFESFGMNDIKLTNIKIYQCDGCNKEIYPEKTIERIERIRQSHAAKSQFLNPNII